MFLVKIEQTLSLKNSVGEAGKPENSFPPRNPFLFGLARRNYRFSKKVRALFSISHNLQSCEMWTHRELNPDPYNANVV